MLLFDDIRSGTYGEALNKIYDDLENVSEVVNLPDDAPHRVVDKVVLEAGTKHADRVKTAIVCPPTIYGPGRGPSNKRSHQVPELGRCTLEKGHGIKVGAGKTFWGNVNVYDLSDLYLKLVEEAAAGGSTKEWPDKPATWGAEGYYFCEGGEHVWGDISQMVATEAKKQGYIKTDEVRSISKEEADQCTSFGSVSWMFFALRLAICASADSAHAQALWGCNSRARAKRARVVLGWDTKAASLEETIKGTLTSEARLLGMEPGHAKIAAGEA